MQPALPIEIVEWILDLIMEETEIDDWMDILMECVLVCRAWVPRCQSYLFRRLQLLCPSSPERIYRLRRRFKTAPHLGRYVQQFELWEPDPLASKPLYTIFLAVLVPCLPSLRHVRLVWGNALFCRNRIFCAPPFRCRTIISLQLEFMFPNDWLSFYDLLPLFPNLHTLTFDGITWPVVDYHGVAIPQPPLSSRQISSLPPIAQLAIATETFKTIEKQAIGDSRVQLCGIQTLLGSIGCTITYLKINLGTFNYLTHPHLHPDPLCTIVWDLPNLETFDIHLRGPQAYPPQEPYAARIARVPKLLWACRAKKLRTVTVYFSQIELREWENLDDLVALNRPLDELVELSHFPHLEKIRFELNSSTAGRTWWNERFAEIFPRLWENGIVENLVILVPVWDTSKFADLPGTHRVIRPSKEPQSTQESHRDRPEP